MTGTQPDLLSRFRPTRPRRCSRSPGALALPAGAVLFQLGGDAEHLFVIDRGRITLTLPMEVTAAKRTSSWRSGRPARRSAGRR